MKTIAVLLLAIAPLLVLADQTKIPTYAAAGNKLYALYVGTSASDSTDVYCGIRFKVDSNDPKRPTNWLSLEHAYAADWMADLFGCKNREECRKHPDPAKRARFNHAEGDLHNLWPACYVPLCYRLMNLIWMRWRSKACLV
jgi:hypothetical protein